MRRNELTHEMRFAAAMGAAGFHAAEIAAILRHGRALHRIAERQCNGYADFYGNEEPRRTLRGHDAAIWAGRSGEDVYLPRGCALMNAAGQKTNADGSLANPILPSIPIPYGRTVKATDPAYMYPAGFEFSGTAETNGAEDYARWIPAAELVALKRAHPAAFASIVATVGRKEWADMRAEMRAEEAIRRIVSEHAARIPAADVGRLGKRAIFAGDPRGAVVKLYRADATAAEIDSGTGNGRDYISVP